MAEEALTYEIGGTLSTLLHVCRGSVRREEMKPCNVPTQGGEILSPMLKLMVGTVHHSLRLKWPVFQTSRAFEKCTTTFTTGGKCQQKQILSRFPNGMTENVEGTTHNSAPLHGSPLERQLFCFLRPSAGQECFTRGLDRSWHLIKICT